MSINKEQFSIGNLFKRIIKEEISKIHTSIPAEIVAVNSNNTVDVRPLINDKNLKGEYVALPVISNVPVKFNRNSTVLISIPLNVKDTGELTFAERSIKNWQLTGGKQNPEDNRRFNLTDCYFSVGLMKDADGITFDENLNIIFNDSKIRIKPSGEIKIENSSGNFTIDSSGNIELEGPEIKIGVGATNKALLGDLVQISYNAFVALYNAHTHPANGTPTSSTTAVLNPASLSTKVKVE